MRTYVLNTKGLAQLVGKPGTADAGCEDADRTVAFTDVR